MSRRLTAACPYQHGLHRNIIQSAWSDLNRRSRAPEALAAFTPKRGQTFPHAASLSSRMCCPFIQSTFARERKNTQRESNPHLRPGETVRCRYVMGAVSPGRIIREEIARRANDVSLQDNRDRGQKSTGWESNPRCRITGAVSWPLNDQCVLSVGPDGLEPSPARVRTECAAANTLIPCCFQWGRRDSNPRRAD